MYSIEIGIQEVMSRITFEIIVQFGVIKIDLEDLLSLLYPHEMPRSISNLCFRCNINNREAALLGFVNKLAVMKVDNGVIVRILRAEYPSLLGFCSECERNLVVLDGS